MPKRVQRKRTKGWKMPEGSVSVTRPGRFGNPYPVSLFGLEVSLALFRNTARGKWDALVLLLGSSPERIKLAFDLHSAFVARLAGNPLRRIQAELRGKDLACWCPLDQPCHADILLEIANAPEAAQ